MLHCGFPGITGKLLYGIARFAVPFFFLVSGYFLYKEHKEDSVKSIPRKLKHIFKVLVVTEIVYLIWHSLQYTFLDNSTDLALWLRGLFSGQSVFQFLILQTTYIGDVSWFLVALCLCYISYYIIIKKNFWNKVVYLIPILLLINICFGEVLPKVGIQLPWNACSNFWLLGFPFFMLGNWVHCNQDEILKRVTNKHLVLVVIGSIFLNLLERIFTDASQLFISNISMATSLFILAIKVPRPKWAENSILKHLAVIGDKYAVFVYILHPIIRDIIRYIVTTLEIETNLLYLWIRPVCVFGISLYLGYIINKIQSKVIR